MRNDDWPELGVTLEHALTHAEPDVVVDFTVPSTVFQNTRLCLEHGTHVVVAANMGGLLTSETWYEKCLAYEHSEEWINQQVAFTFLSFTYGFGQHTKQIDAKFLEHSQIKSELLGGSTSIDPADWRNWARCYRRDLAAPHSNQPSNTY